MTISATASHSLRDKRLGDDTYFTIHVVVVVVVVVVVAVVVVVVRSNGARSRSCGKGAGSRMILTAALLGAHAA